MQESWQSDERDIVVRILHEQMEGFALVENYESPYPGDPEAFVAPSLEEMEESLRDLLDDGRDTLQPPEAEPEDVRIYLVRHERASSDVRPTAVVISLSKEQILAIG